MLSQLGVFLAVVSQEVVKDLVKGVIENPKEGGTADIVVHDFLEGIFAN